MSHEIVVLMIIVIFSQISGASHKIKTTTREEKIDFYERKLKEAQQSVDTIEFSVTVLLITIVLRTIIALFALLVIFSLIS